MFPDTHPSIQEEVRIRLELPVENHAEAAASVEEDLSVRVPHYLAGIRRPHAALQSAHPGGRVVI